MERNKFKIVHTADIHFGVENYGKTDPKTGLNLRLLDFVKVFNDCISRAILDQADLFILAGDAYKTANPTPTQQKLLLQALCRLYKAKIPVVIIVGNHDYPISFGKAHALDLFASLPVDGFFVFDELGVKNIKTKSGIIQIVGVPWPSRKNLAESHFNKFATNKQITKQIAENTLRQIQNFAKSLNPSLPAILTGHLTVASGVFSGSERQAIFGNDPLFDANSLAIHPFDYVALGHLHRYQNLNLGGIPVVYSGSLERIDFGEVRDEKGFCVVDIDVENNATKINKKTSLHFISSNPRSMIEIKIKLKVDYNFTEQILAEIAKHSLDEAIVKLTYLLPSGYNDSVNYQKIYSALSSAWFVASVNPVHQPLKKKARIDLSEQVSLEMLLKQYFNSRDLPLEKTEELVKLALKLQDLDE